MAMDEALDLDATFSEEDLIETPLEDPVSDEEETEDEEDDAEEAEEV